MKLRKKIFLSISLIWIGFLIISYLVGYTFLLQHYLKLEQSRAERDISRVDESLVQIKQSLSAFATDWSQWNDLYEFMRHKNNNFVQNNLTMTAYVTSSINLIMYWDNNKKLIAGGSVDLVQQTEVPYPAGLSRYINAQSVFLQPLPNDFLQTNIFIDHKVMLIAAVSITDSRKIKPIVGTGIFGRYLTPEILNKIQATSKVNLKLITQDDDLFKQILAHYGDKKHLFIPAGDDLLYGYSLLKDVNEKPIAFFQMSSPRTIYSIGLESIHYFLNLFLLLGVLFSILMLIIIRKLVVNRLEVLNKTVTDIITNQDLTQRLPVNSGDEISSLSSQMNTMLEKIQHAHHDLEERVADRTRDLQQANITLKQEISDRVEAEKQLVLNKEHLVRLAHYDNLTGLPNRVFFNEMLTKTLNHSHRQHKTIALLYVDIDRFKRINDALGHSQGDEALKKLSARFSNLLRAGDLIARLSGDEFIIMLYDVAHPKFASHVAEKIIVACSEPIAIGIHNFYLTASIGICIYPEDGNSIEELHINADLAMYKAKNSGGNQFQYFTKEMNLMAHEHIKLEAALRRAINNDEFILYFQPKINLSSRKLEGVEALIRWIDPELGLISPLQFIPLAEETGLIMQIGEWVLRRACHINKKWQDAGYAPISVAVNLSPKQFRHQDLAQLVRNVLSESLLQPEYLELEITETAVMDDVTSAIDRLNAIKEMGVKISVDDFGTGYTSISYLKKFPVSLLKIDQSFIRGIPDSANDMAITSAVIAMAHSLGMRAVAEGVETIEQLDFLISQNCDLVQGYYFSKPVPENEIILQFSRT